METNEKKQSKGKRIAGAIGFTVLVYLGFTALFLTRWIMKAMPGTDTESMIFQLKVPLEGTDWSAFAGMFRAFLLWAPIGTVIVVIAAHFIRCRTWLKVSIAGIFALFFWCFGLNYISFFNYVYAQIKSSNIYEEEYADPETTEITFPERKRNLIYIYLESMEITFMDEASGGINTFNPLPNLTELALENECFGDGTVLNGPQMTVGSSWTMASFVAQNTGVPLCIPIEGNSMSSYGSFLPGAYSLGQILETQGYRQEVIIGSKKTFSGFDTFLESHGNPTVIDWPAAQEAGYLPSKDYKAWWGYEDRYLFQIAEQQLTEMASSDEPFALTLMTMDTHRVGGYQCALCDDEYENQYDNVLACSDRQIAAFLSWLSEQDFYENTTVILAGDHQTMDGDYVSTLTIPSDYTRKQYYVIVNGAAKKQLTTARTYTTLDLFPTTLAAMGCEINGNRLGLGTNLYSDVPTLAEEKGYDWLNGQLELQSSYYKNHLLYGE